MAVPQPRAVVFDLDGTLVDTLDDITLALGRALAKHGKTALDREVVAGIVGDGARMLVARALSASPDSRDVDAMLRTFLDAYETDPTPGTRLMPGAIALLDALAARAIPAVVCTNKPARLARVVVEATLGDRIAATFGAGDTARLKPDPEPILAALARVGVAPGSAWMVGDGPQDIAAARAASVFAVWCRHGYGRAEGADLTIDALDELIQYLG